MQEFIQKARENSSEVWVAQSGIPVEQLWQSIPDLPQSGWCWEDNSFVRQWLPSFAHSSSNSPENSLCGCTSALLGIAQTGTVVVSGAMRKISLLPPIHICLLSKSQIVASLQEAFAAVRKEADSHSIVFITGPSRTADIEQTLTLGVHGPHRLIIILME